MKGIRFRYPVFNKKQKDRISREKAKGVNKNFNPVVREDTVNAEDGVGVDALRPVSFWKVSLCGDGVELVSILEPVKWFKEVDQMEFKNLEECNGN
jgi:hypothetical protein